MISRLAARSLIVTAETFGPTAEVDESRGACCAVERLAPDRLSSLRRAATEAVRLCLGENHPKPFKDDRAILMAEYRGLVCEERVAFVAFHQSFSYEGFVKEASK